MNNAASNEEQKLAKLKPLIYEGLDDLTAGNVRPGKEVFAELRDKINSESTAKN